MQKSTYIFLFHLHEVHKWAKAIPDVRHGDLVNFRGKDKGGVQGAGSALFLEVGASYMST